jgi:squalene cyclase
MNATDRGRQWIFPAASLLVIVVILLVVNGLRGDTRTPLQRGVDWIASKQHEDGAWRGEEIGVLRPGPAMTAFVLYAMAPYRNVHPERVIKAARYLETQVTPEGSVGTSDYPTYATSLTILAFAELKRDVSRLVDYLKRAQHAETGGWAFGGNTAHRLDISTTRYALEALAAANVAPDDPVWEKARRFLDRCQNPDGGFRFTTVEGQDKNDGRSYGSATADGLRSLRAAGGSKERIFAAESWIKTHFTAERCPGFPPDHPRNWADGLLGYWLAAVRPFADKEAIAKVLIPRQRSDGSWRNPVDLMLENEPLLATTLAVLALAP